MCINQDDVEERNHQVTLMREIYRRAQKVIAWLGPQNAHKAVKAIIGAPLDSKPGAAMLMMEAPDSLKAVKKLFSLPYWDVSRDFLQYRLLFLRRLVHYYQDRPFILQIFRQNLSFRTNSLYSGSVGIVGFEEGDRMRTAEDLMRKQQPYTNLCVIIWFSLVMLYGSSTS